MSETGVVVLAHGSRGDLGSQAVTDTLDRIAKGLKVILSSDVEIIGGAMQFNHPDLEEAAKSLIVGRAKLIVIAPYFLFPGRHVTEDIPETIKMLEASYPEVKFTLADNLGLDESFVEVMAKRIIEVCPSLSPTQSATSVRPEQIEQLSMDIIDKLLPILPIVSEEERTVVKRIVHTCGDVQIARLVKFSPSALSSAVSAIDRGSPIITDVRMVASGISPRFLEMCGCSVTCALDGAPSERESMLTRTAQAMYNLGERANGAILAIGNAPTALLALIDMIEHRGITPAVVIGMPVGFVRAAESKAKLISSSIPYITVEGTRGGSAMTATTVNALIGIARNKSKSIEKAVDYSRN